MPPFVIVPQPAVPGQPIVVLPLVVSPNGSTTQPGSNGAPSVITQPLQQPQAGLDAIKLPSLVPGDLPVIIIPQQDTVIEGALPFTVQPDPTGGPPQLIAETSAAINFPFVFVPPTGLTGPLHLIIPPQTGTAGLPLVVVPQGTPIPPAPPAPTLAPAVPGTSSPPVTPGPKPGIQAPPLGDAGLKDARSSPGLALELLLIVAIGTGFWLWASHGHDTSGRK